jgi:diphthamide biosynthesis enzyme Dph1/Dph2-like protein
MELDLELDRVIEAIRGNERVNTVLIQLPDGLKPKAAEIQKEIETHTDAQVLIWAGSCFGACDIPHVNGIDLLVAFGHSRWVY